MSKKTALISEKEYELKASDYRLKDRENKIDRLKKEKTKLEEEIEKLEINQRKLMSTSVDEETVVVLQETLESERLRKKILEDDIENLNIELKNKDYEIRNLQNTISQIRNGESELATVGRTYNLDTGTLNKTTLIYVKVFEELPYLKLYCNHLFKMLLETTYNSGLMVVIKNDDGLDSKIFQGLGLLANFNDLEVNNLITLSIHKGIGAGLIIDKKLYRGTDGEAGEIGKTLVSVIQNNHKTFHKIEDICSQEA